MTRCETRMNRHTMNTRSTTASGNDKKNRNGDGATKQGQKTKRAKKAKREDSATKRYRLKSLDLQQKIRLALEARRMASLTNRQIPREFQPSFRGSGGIPAPAFIVGLELMEWRRCHNERWKRMTPKEHVRMQQQVLKQIEARPSEFDASTGKRIPSARSMLGKGGILPPEGLTVDERSAWHKAHNALWERLSERERCEMKQQQTSNGHCSRNDAPKNNTEVEVAREQKVPNATAAQEGIDSVRTSNKRARSPEGSDASSDSFYYDAEEVITDKESVTMPPSRKRVRFNDSGPTEAIGEHLGQRLENEDATAAEQENLTTRPDDPGSGVTAQESLAPGLEILELAEKSLAPRVFVTPNPNVNQPFIRVVNIDSEAEFSQKMNDDDDTPVSYFDFGPNFQLSDLHIHEILLRRPSFFQSVVQITAGSPEIRLPLTDIGLVRLVSACTILENLSIHGGIHFSDRSVAAVISECKYIRHLALCGADFEPNNVYGAALHQLVGLPVATNLDKIVLKNTRVNEAMVKRLRDERPVLKIGYSG